MRTTRNRTPIVVTAALALVTLAVAAPTARAQAAAGPYRGNYPGYYYSPGGYSGGRYFYPGYYANPAPAAAPARPNYNYNYNYNYNPGYYSTPARHPAYNPEDWSTGRTNYPIPLTKPWMMPLHY